MPPTEQKLLTAEIAEKSRGRGEELVVIRVRKLRRYTLSSNLTEQQSNPHFPSSSALESSFAKKTFT